MTTELIISIVSPIAGSLVGFIFGRRKANAEANVIENNAKDKELDLVQEAILIWRETAEEKTRQLKEAHALIEKLNNMVDELKAQNSDLSEKYKSVVESLEKLRRDYDSLLRKYKQLKND